MIIFLALAIIGLVLLQRSEGGGLGIGGGGGLGGIASPQGTANVLTKVTTFCAIAFFCTSLLLGILAGNQSQSRQSIMDVLDETPAPADDAEMEIQVEEDGSVTIPPGPSAPVAE